MKYDNTKDIFPVNTSNERTRWHEKYAVTFAHTDRLANSAIPYMQKLLNGYEKENKKKKK